MGPDADDIEVGMSIGAALPGGSVSYVSEDPSSPMACAVRGELAAQGKAVEVQGPKGSENRASFNMASSNVSGPAVSAPAPAPAPQVTPNFSA